MTTIERVSAFENLGNVIREKTNNSSLFWEVIESAHFHNPWFTPEFCRYAIESIAQKWLNKKSLNEWVSRYPSSYFEPKTTKNIGVVMAGNVPFVGLHDMLCVLVSGHNFVGKQSSKDGDLMQGVINLLLKVEPRFSNSISILEGKLENFDAVIATGSNNSARYFEYYFGKYPNIIRKNRHSIAILSGSETEEELSSLASDIFTYFGLGCRNVSKVLVPKGFDLKPLFNAFEPYKNLINHNKYANNYEYHRAIYLMNQVTHFDNGFLILKPDDGLGSPVGVLFYQHYSNLEGAISYVDSQKESIQCVVSNNPQIPNSIPLGTTQEPKLDDYADGIDTLDFLAKLG